jgi:hypothetical protein
VGEQYQKWGLQVWDAVDPELRGGYPTSLDQFRIVQYESCRGLEGWAVVAFGIDEFFDLKVRTAQVSETQRSDMFYEESAAALEYAKKWIMIPLTRAIDTLVLHVKDETSYMGRILRDLHNQRPHDIQWIKF